MNTAFELQCMGKTTLAFYAFKDAYQLALKNGESPAKLAALEKLFGWYRTYGYSCGLLKEPSKITTEYRKTEGPAGSRFDPRQEKIMRDFLCGVGCVISGVFCIYINPPITGKFGTGLVLTGFKYMYDSISAMVHDHQEKKLRIAEMNSLESKISSVTE